MNVSEEMVQECLCKTDIDSWDETDVYILTKELASRLLQPTPGPPDLEGVPDDATIVVAWNDAGDWMVEWGTASEASTWDMSERNMPGIVHLASITPPEPELPKCPWCGNPLMVTRLGNDHIIECVNQECVPNRRFKTEAEAIAAARKAGE